MKRVILIALSLVLGSWFTGARQAQAHEVYGPACTGASSFTYDQCDNSINDEGDQFRNQFSGNCYGACGPGCTTNCGSGGACQTHDYYTRRDGMFSSSAMSAFPPAAVQWGKCVMAAGGTAASGWIKSSWSGIKKAASSVVNRVFN
jgi:hypothetical protein